MIATQKLGGVKLSDQQKIKFTPPRIHRLGNIVTKTGQGGSSKEYDSYDENRK